METLTIIFLIFMFFAIYFFVFFFILFFKNRETLFSYPEPKTDFKVSVIMPAYNEEESIEDTVDHVMQLNYPKENLELIVVNDQSSDGTLKILRKLALKYKNLKVIDKKNSGKADSVNWGIRASKGELIAIVDCDSFPSRDSLKKLTGYFRDPQMSAVTSFVYARNKDESFFTKLQSVEYIIMAFTRKLLDYVDSVYVTNGPLSLYRKEYILKVGGFDPKTVTEDVDITWNLLKHGYKTSMCMDAGVSTIVPNDFKRWYHQRVRWGLGGLQALVKYKDIFLRKGMFGMFVLPYVSFSIIVSMYLFLLTSYLLIKSVLQQVMIYFYSTAANTYIFSMQDINLYPSVTLFYFVLLFVMSFGFSLYILKRTNYEERTIPKLFNLVFYSVIYLTIYAVLWFPAFYRFFSGDMRWGKDDR